MHSKTHRFGPFGFRIPLLLALLFTSWIAPAQDLSIQSIVLKGGDVLINYDLVDDNVDHRYTLSLYSSQDNYVQPLLEVEGDVGIDQSVGGNKQIVWHAQKELGDDFKGDVAIEVKGKIYIPFVTLNGFEEMGALKRGKPYKVTWVAGRGSNVLTFDLFNKKGEMVHSFTNIANVGEYDIELPKGVKAGKGYRFRITDQKNKEDVVYTPEFTIKRKVPLYVNAALASLALVTGYLVSQNISSGGGEDGEAPLLPDPTTPF